MIIISAGLQKSGSGLFFNLTNDLLVAAGGKDIHEIKEKFKLEGILKYYNCNIGELSESHLTPLLPLHEEGYSFVVKTHHGPTTYLKMLMNKGIVKATCIYRDPRDVVLSALDYGKQLAGEEKANPFASCTSIENTIPIVKSWLNNSIMKWLEWENIFLVKYENLITTPIEELKQLADFLDIDNKFFNIDLDAIYSRYYHEKLDDFQVDYLHFNVGEAGRFGTALQEKELNMCNQHFCSYLERMGYSL